ncbi:MAG: hypothetical protein ACK58L_18495 [Planctomycetota bacterium]
MDPRPLFFSIVVAFVFVTANVLTEKSLEPGKTWVFALACGLACVALLGFRWCCQQFGLAIASAVVDSLLTLLTVGYAVLILRERLSSIQYAGLALLLLGILLVKGPWSGQHSGASLKSTVKESAE